MLAICFSLSVFSTILWVFYSCSMMFEKLGSASFSSLSLADASLHLSLIIVPIFLVWIIFGFVMQFLFNNTLNKNLYHLFQQMKKNQEYTDVVARLLLETERQVKDSFVMDKVDVLIADLNEILSEIIYKTKIASKEQIDILWQKAQNGGKWVFAKVIIEVWQNQSNFLTRVLDRAQSDVVLSGSILEFCARYLNLIALLDKHDKGKVFLNLIEAGVLGKVFSIFAPLDDEIKKRRGFVEVEKKIEPEFIAESEVVVKKDDFSIALERSFKPEEIVVQAEPKEFELESVKKDWEKLQNMSFNKEETIEQEEPKFDISMTNDNEEKVVLDEASKKDDEETMGYPFANWGVK